MTVRILKVRWADQNVKRFGKRLVELNARFPKVLPRIVNQVGDRAKTQVIRNLTRQTGLPRKTIVKAVGDPHRAHASRLSYEMVTRGGNIRLKYLQPKETRPGVTAIPWGKRKLFPGTFMKGGRFPNRKVVAKFDGHVYRRLNTSGTRITQARSGMFIPTEMTTGATKAGFERIAGPLLQQRVEAAISKLLG
jgi:hypothetical protein